MKQPLVIIKTGSAAAPIREQFGDFEEWLYQGMGLPAQEVRLIRVVDGEPLPSPAACGGVVITGSHAMVTDALPWSVTLAHWLPAVIEQRIPLLGICYGHQLLAAAMGGEVGYHPAGPEVGTVAIELLPAAQHDPLFASLPALFPAQAFHSQSVLTLPPDAVWLARNNFEPHHAFRLNECAWGVQFHPEYSGTIMRAEIEADQEELMANGLDSDKLLASVLEGPEAASLLARFAVLARSHNR